MRIPTAIRIPLYIKESILLWPYFLLIFIGLFLPSTAKHGMLNMKSLLFFMSVISIGFLIFKRFEIRKSTIHLLFFFCLFMIFLIAWFFIGAIDHLSLLEAQLDQMKLFIITLSIPLMTIYLIKEEILNPQKFLKAVIYSNYIYCAFKLGIFFLQIGAGVDIWKFLTGSGIRIQSMTIFGSISRLQSSVDVATPFLLFFVLQSRNFGIKFSKKFIFSYVIISILSNLLAFSRFLIFIQFLGFLFYLFTANIKQFFTGALIIIGLTTLGVYSIGVKNVSTAIEARFFSKNAFISDQERSQQINAMLDEFDKAPFFGLGLGGYAKENIRDRDLKHSYEVQWISFLMQFGIFGIIFLLFALSLIAYQYLRLPINRRDISVFVLFGCWLLSGFTNPFLISLQSGIIYTLFYVSKCLGIVEFKERRSDTVYHLT